MHEANSIKKLRKLSIWCLFISILAGFFGMILKEYLMVILGAILLTAYYTISVKYWKCPHCKARLPMRFDSNKDVEDTYCCPYCYEVF